MILWTIPVSFVVSLFSLQSLSRVIPQLKGCVHMQYHKHSKQGGRER